MLSSVENLCDRGIRRQDHRLALGVGGRDLLDGELVSDSVVDVVFAHTAGHTVHLQDRFCHSDISFLTQGEALTMPPPCSIQCLQLWL